MNLNVEFGEICQIVPALMPVDLSSGANTGDWVSLKNYQRATVVILCSIGTAGDDITVTAQQATAVAGTGAKDLAIIDRVYRKQGATAINAVGQYTLDAQTAAATWTNLTNAENELLITFDVMPEQLDTDNDFDCFNVSIADVGTNAQLGCALYLLYGARFGAGALLPSAIAD